MKALLKALFEAKKQIQPIVKDSKNPFFNSKYFDINQLLESVEPILHNHGLIITQPIDEGYVITQIWHVDSGEKIESKLKMPEVLDPQKLGSAITYFRRYGLQSLLALQAEDDDANSASVQTKQLAELKTLGQSKGKTEAEVMAVYKKLGYQATKEKLNGLEQAVKMVATAFDAIIDNQNTK
jgi:hypothetical protein